MPTTIKIELWLNDVFIKEADLDELTTPIRYIALYTDSAADGASVTIHSLTTNYNIYSNWGPVFSIESEVDRGINVSSSKSSKLNNVANSSVTLSNIDTTPIKITGVLPSINAKVTPKDAP